MCLLQYHIAAYREISVRLVSDTWATPLTNLNSLRAAAANRPKPATPQNIVTKLIATVVAIAREATYPQLTPLIGPKSTFFKVPPIGTIMLLVGYLAWVLLLEFVNNDIAGAQHYTSLGVRAAWLAVGQVPLLILLAGKNNLIGLVTGISYERLNILHRWVARVFLLLALLHMVFLHTSWNAYDLGPLEYATDSCIPTGWATFSIVIWMNISTFAPLRHLSYEFFVAQHLVTFIGMLQNYQAVTLVSNICQVLLSLSCTIYQAPLCILEYTFIFLLAYISWIESFAPPDMPGIMPGQDEPH